MKKKLISILLTLIMVLAMIPMTTGVANAGSVPVVTEIEIEIDEPETDPEFNIVAFTVKSITLSTSVSPIEDPSEIATMVKSCVGIWHVEITEEEKVGAFQPQQVGGKYWDMAQNSPYKSTSGRQFAFLVGVTFEEEECIFADQSQIKFLLNGVYYYPKRDDNENAFCLVPFSDLFKKVKYPQTWEPYYETLALKIAAQAEIEASKMLEEAKVNVEEPVVTEKVELVSSSEETVAPNDKNSVKVTWKYSNDKPLEFEGYDVYRAANNGEYKFMFNTTNEWYYNTLIRAGQKYTYKVKGYNTVNGEKVYSEFSTETTCVVK